MAAEIAAVISNKPDAAGLQFAQSQGIPTLVVERKSFAFAKVLIKHCKPKSIRLVQTRGLGRLYAEF